MPFEAATDPNCFQPNHPMTTFLAKTSPKPSITPFTNGKSKLMASEARAAFIRVRVDREESKMTNVAVRDASSLCGTGEGDGEAVRAGNDIEGKEEVGDERTSSQFCDVSVVVSACL